MNTEKKLTGYASIDKPWLKYYSEEAINAPLPECTIYEYLWNCNKERLKKTALNYYGRCSTYAHMFTEIDRVAKAFSKLGVKKGEFVSFCMLTMPETIYSFYALNKLGAVCNFIEPRTNAELIKNRIKDSDSRILIVVDAFLPKILKFVQDTNLEKIIVVPISESMPLLAKVMFNLTKGRKIPKVSNDLKYQYWKQFLEQGNNAVPIYVKYEKDQPAAIIYTGGTTGVSKGAVLSNDCFIAMAVQAYYDAPLLFTKKRFLGIMPPFTAYGLIFGHFIPFCAGLENCLIPVFKPERFVDLVIKYKPNHVVGVPAFFENLANSNKLKNRNISYLTSYITGGDRMLVATEKHINKIYKEHGCKYQIMKGYGMTEMGSAASFTAIKECNAEGSVGIPGHYTTIKVIDPYTFEEVKYNVHGELCLTGPTMMLGYYNNEQETNNVIKKHSDGLMWVHSGDIGYITEDGIIYIVDRIKRMIIRPDGHNVWPSQIENVIMKHNSVMECSVVGLPNPEHENGKIPTAFIVLKDGVEPSTALMQEIDMFSKKHLPERDVAMAYQFCDSLPLTTIGKVDYRTLEKLAQNER